MEWMVRLVQEPRRLLPRYLSTNAKFCLLIANAVGARIKQRMIAD